MNSLTSHLFKHKRELPGDGASFFFGHAFQHAVALNWNHHRFPFIWVHITSSFIWEGIGFFQLGQAPPVVTYRDIARAGDLKFVGRLHDGAEVFGFGHFRYGKGQFIVDLDQRNFIPLFVYRSHGRLGLVSRARLHKAVECFVSVCALNIITVLYRGFFFG